jgi:hypothetical protein
LAAFVLGLIATVASMAVDHKTILFLAALAMLGGLTFFAFTEAFLFSPPERSKFAIWRARVFFLATALAALSLILEAVTPAP